MAGDTYRWTASASGGSWGVPANWADVTTGASPAPTAPGAADAVTVDGEAPDQFEVVDGPGAAASLALLDDNALQGGLFAVGTLTLGAPPAGAAQPGATDILAGGTLAASGAAADPGPFEVDGAGASLAVAGALAPGSAGGSDIYVVNFASLQAASWTVSGMLYVDTTAYVTVGAAPASVQGAISVQNGATLTLSGLATVDGQVVDDGLVAAGPNGVEQTETIAGDFSGSGALDVGVGSALTVAMPAGGPGGTVSGLSAITLAPAAAADLTASLSAMQIANVGTVDVGAFDSLAVSGTLSATGPITFGAHAGGSFGTVVNAGQITVGQSADVTFAGDVTGSAGISIATGATVTADGTLSGLSGITLASGATLDFVKTPTTVGTDANVPVSLAGSDVIGVQDGVAVDGAVGGFDGTDAIVNSSSLLELGGTIVTDATLTAGGLLSLTTDSVQTASVQLAGSYAGQRFLTVGAGEGLADGDTLIELAATTAALPAGGMVTGGNGAAFQVLTGTGSGAGLSFTGDNAVVGTASTDDLTVSGSAAGTLNTLLIEAGGAVSATGTADIESAAEVDGAAAALTVAGALTLGGGPGEAELASVDGGRVRLGGLDITGYSGMIAPASYGAAILVDPAGAIEVGSAGGAAAGALSIDAGQAVTSRTLNALVIGNVVDDGTLEVAAPANPDVFLSSLQVTGGVSGGGALLVDPNESLVIGGAVAGAGSLGVGKGSELLISGSLDTTAALSTGDGSTVTVGGTTRGLSALTTGAGSRLTLAGAASGLGPIGIGVTATADFADLSGTGAMQVGAGAEVTVDGTVSALPQITLGLGASLGLFGADQGVGITFDGQDRLTLGTGVPVTGTLTGFDATDLVVNQSVVPAVDGGEILTGATYAATGAGTGTLTLTDDGTVVNTLTLAGAYTSGEFLTNAAIVNDATAGVTDVAIAGPTQNGLPGPTVTGGTGSTFDVLAGAGTASGAETFLDNLAVEGAFTAAGVTVGGMDDASAVPALDIEAGGSLTSTGAAAILTGAEVDGAGAAFVSQTLTLGGGAGNADLLVVNGGAVRTGALTLAAGAGALAPTATLYVDPQGSVQVGTGAAATAGSVVVAAGASLTDQAPAGRIGAALVDDGTVEVAAPASAAAVPDTLQVDGLVTGSGAITVADGQSLTLVQRASDLSSITTGKGATLTADADLSGVASVTTGQGSTSSFASVFGVQTLSEGAGASLSISGDLGASSGTFDIGAGANASVFGGVTDISGITLEAGASLTLSDLDRNVPIYMKAGTTLNIASVTMVEASIFGFTQGDVIRVSGQVVTGATERTGSGTGISFLDLSIDGRTINTLTLSGDYDGDQFVANAAGAGGYTDVVLAAMPCFAAGTRILTDHGPVPVERLRVGNSVLAGAARAPRPVRWIGDRATDVARHPHPERVRPVRVRAGAFGPGLPSRDLVLSPDHAVFAEGVLIPVKRLVDGRSVVTEHAARVRYLHVELDSHDVIYAEDLPVESFLDTGVRAQFGDGPAVPLHPDFAARAREASCAPLAVAGPQVDAVRLLLARRSAALAAA